MGLFVASRISACLPTLINDTEVEKLQAEMGADSSKYFALESKRFVIVIIAIF